jgi:hypothetical protein
MFLVKIIHLHALLDVKNGPAVEDVEFDNIEKLMATFMSIDGVSISRDTIFKNRIPVAKIFTTGPIEDEED